MDKSTARHNDGGTIDSSIRRIKPVPKNFPQYTPLVIANTEHGDYARHHVTGGEAIALFGSKFLDRRSKFSNHATLHAELVFGTGASTVVQRVRTKITNPDGTTRYANSATKTLFLAYYLDENQEGRYLRDVKGRVALDANNERQTDDNDLLDVYKYAVVSKYVQDGQTLRTYKEDIDGTEVTFVPITTLEAEAHGKWYNNIGVAIWSKVGREANTGSISGNKSLTFGLKVYDDNLDSRKPIKTIEGSSSIEFSLQPYSVDPLTGRANDFAALFPEEYGNYIDPSLDLQPYTFIKNPIQDEDGISIAFKELMKEESYANSKPETAAIVDALMDFPAIDDKASAEMEEMVEDHQYLLNFANAMYSQDIEYEVIRPVDTAMVGKLKDANYDTAMCDEDMPVFLEGGEDGDITDLDLYEAAVVTEIARYADKSDPVTSIPLNRDTVIVDTGFKLETKLDMAPYIGGKHNTFAVLGTYTFNKDNVVPELSDDLATAALLSARYSLYVESKEHGTPSMRACIILGSGVIADKSYRYRLPATFDYSVKAAKFYGPLNGNWNNAYAFNRDPGNRIETLIDVEPKWIEDDIKDKLQESNLIWPDNTEDNFEFFWPSHQTIYPEDRSIFNNVKTVIANATIHTVNDGAWRKYSGTDDMTETELKMAVEAYVEKALKGRFTTEIKTKAEVYYTNRDRELGWVWRLRVSITAPMGYTVMYSDTEGFRTESTEG